MTHLVEERLDLVPAQEAHAAVRCRGPLEVGHEHHDRELEASRAARRRDAFDVQQIREVHVPGQVVRVAVPHVVLDIVRVHAARAAHRVVRGARRLARARVQVAVDRADHAALRLVDHLELQHVRAPDLTRLHRCRAEVDAVEQVKQAREAGKHTA